MSFADFKVDRWGMRFLEVFGGFLADFLDFFGRFWKMFDDILDGFGRFLEEVGRLMMIFGRFWKMFGGFLEFT